MKTRFNTYDIVCSVSELQRLVGMRVNQVYDIDNKAYLLRLQRSEEKSILLLESANRFHTTHFEWPKNVAPSGFTMKLRKHLKNKRLEKMTQIGIDRVVDFQFGTGEAAYHVILELYDRGNIVLTDYEWTILNVLRPHVEGDKIRFAVKEKYPLERGKTRVPPPSGDALRQILADSKPGDNLKKILNPNLEYGPGIIDHILSESGLAGTMRLTSGDGPGFNVERDMPKLETALALGEELLDAAASGVAKGYIIQKKEERPNPAEDGSAYLLTNQEFHPMLYAQHRNQPYQEYETFDRAVDEFYSTLEGQKIDMKTIQVEREAMKKLQNVRKDHDKRLTELERVQQADRDKAELISRNQQLVDHAILAVQAALANQMSWEDIRALVKTAQQNKDPVASIIKHLKLESNHITLHLSDPYDHSDSDEGGAGDWRMKPMLVDVDLALTAHANARRYYDQKRSAAKKQQKTLDAQGKALKSAERKTKQTLKEVQTISSINKARKTYWFEKFFWFISSENYLVIGGRDQQQNELLVKRYLRAGDVYVHADVSGAATIVVKNPAGGPVPPKTLNEAGQVAVAYSVAWEAKVLTGAWWVHASQVSKSAPTGEYLSTGSFMIRGKKNYLLPQHLMLGFSFMFRVSKSVPTGEYLSTGSFMIRGKKNYLLPQHLMLGFSFMFRLEESSIERHRDERKVLSLNEEPVESQPEQEEQEIVVSDDEDTTSVHEDKKRLESISEEIERDNPNIKIEIKDNTEDNEPVNEHKEEQPSPNDSDTDSSDETFPDTHIKVDHGTGKVIMQSKTRTISEMTDDSKSDVVFLGDDKPLVFPTLPQSNQKGGKKAQAAKKESQAKKEQEKLEKERKDGLKRGQRSKLKKIKDKYKDQDDEERQAWLESTKPTGQKDTKKAQKKLAASAGGGGGGGGGKGKSAKGQARIPMPAPVLLEGDEEEDDAENEAEVAAGGAGAGAGGAGGAEVDMLHQLTGCPLPEDELLFAVPVIAPYSLMTNYKFKVKLTPGTGKRGKAAKTAVQVFLRDKACSARERDLLKAVKDEDIARNFPGKVKLSAPQLQKHRK